MSAFRIGVIVDSFRLPVDEALIKAKELGADGFQVFTVSGAMSAEALSPAARVAFKTRCAELGLEIAALCGDLGGHGFQIAAENPDKLRRSKAIVDLAVDLDARVVTTHIGVVPQDAGDPVYATMRDACRELGAYAAARGVIVAIETGPETAAVLGRFLDDVGSPGIGVNLDPANLVMVVADDPVQAVYTLRKYIVHTHAKDGVQLKPCDPVAVYTAFAEGGVEALDIGTLFNEVPLGEGGVDWERYLAALADIGYDGYLTIEREVGADPARDIGHAVRFLRARIG